MGIDKLGGSVTAGGVPVAEPGFTTSEFAVTIGGFIAALLTLLVTFNVHISADQQHAVLGFVEPLLAVIVLGYNISRGIRKAGTAG